MTTSSLRSRLVSALTASTLVMAGVLSTVVAVVAVSPGTALADTAPADAATPVTVSDDALPTVQINGVVWSQVTLGNTVYVTGSFTSARPAGSPAGTNEIVRKNLLAYDIRTGELIQSFDHRLNAQGMVLTLSPDSSRLYVGGDFTMVDGVAHNRIIAIDTATGALIPSFSPQTDDRVHAITATNTMVYAGGLFATANGVARTRLAAFSADKGALLSWAPTADDHQVLTMLLTPSGSKVLIGGSFASVNAATSPGLAALDPVTGATMPWSITAAVRNSGDNAGIQSLRTDGTSIYGTGFVFGPGGNLEGAFSADPETGAERWIEDCHGDSYDVLPVGKVAYVVSHSHFCGDIGQYPETTPRTFYRATAFSTDPTGTLTHNPISGYADWAGHTSPAQLAWYPTITSGTYTGQDQGAWSLTGNSQYVALGGEFPTVNSSAQQGLVRFAVRSIAPNTIAPAPSTLLNPTLTSPQAGSVRIAWRATFDRDNENLTYKLVRDGKTATPIYTTTAASRPFNTPSLGFTDTGLVPGSTHTYRLYVTDPLGNSQTGSTVTATVATAPTDGPSGYVADVAADGASDYWQLGEAAGTVLGDSTGYNNLTAGVGVTLGAPGALPGSTAATLSGTSTGWATAVGTQSLSGALSVESWVKTTSTSGGVVLSFGSSSPGTTSANYDREVWFDNPGHLVFGVTGGDAVNRLARSGRTYNDGAWHHVVATMTSGEMALYVDGIRVARNTSVTTTSSYLGYWRIGGETTSKWTTRPTSNFLSGSIDDVAVYPTALTAAKVRQHYTDSGRTVAVSAPADALGNAVFTDSPDVFYRLDESTGSAADSSGGAAAGTYSGGVTRGAASPVTGSGTATTFNGTDGLLVAPTPVDNPTVYSEELWFSTTTTRGGKLIGFGSATSGLSGNYDRHVWMLNGGQVAFGAYNGAQNVLTSPLTYNDGKWHHVVATQGTDGMHLYLDGAQVGANTVTGSQSFTGYWRVGGDRVWSGASSNYFAGTIDDVAVYSTQLSFATARSHFRLSPAAVDKAPVLALLSSCVGLACAFDASASTDNDGGIASLAWDYGDGATSTTAAGTHTYQATGSYTVRLTATDDQGVSSTTTRVLNVSPLPADAYGQAVRTDSPSLFWRLDETTGTTAADGSPNNVLGTLAGGVTLGQASPVTGAAGAAVAFGGTNGGLANRSAAAAPTVYSEELWFSTTTTKGGKLIGYGSASSGLSGSYDRHVWMLNGGQLSFGAYNGTQTTLTSAGAYNDGKWHHLVASQGLAGMRLYVDGAQVGANSVTAAQAYTGYWRVGGDKVWSGATSNYFAGLIDEVAIYPTQLTAASVAAHYAASPAWNRLPVAAATGGCAELSCSFSGAASSDSDGTLASYTWNFGDGSTGSGAATSHSYTAGGSYTVTLTVTDNRGGTASTTVGVVASPPNAGPTASGTASCARLVCSFDATGSTDSDGTVASFAWDFGDGSSGAAATATHTYATAGARTATLTVTDDDGATGTTTVTVTSTPANSAPTAAATGTCTDLSCTVSDSGSTDPDGAIASWAWNFGDGSTGSGATATHTYAAAGTFTVTLTVTDNEGATGTTTTTVTSVAPNLAPTASFTTTCSALTCSTDAGGSADSDGTLAAYTWNFSDGATATGATASHTYATAGTWTVSLTVTDDDGATGSTTRTVTPRPAANPTPATLAADAFGRATTGGFGTADTGGLWRTVGTASALTVSAGTAAVSVTPASQTGAYLGDVLTTDADVTVGITADKAPNGGGLYTWVTGRRVATNTEYRARVKLVGKSVGVSLSALPASSTEKVLAAETILPGVSWLPGQVLRTRLQVTGTNPTTLRVRVWPTGTAEPTTWQLTATDATAALQKAGSPGLTAYLSGSATTTPVSAQFSDLRVKATPTSPTAAFALTCATLTCDVDAAASSEPAGGALTWTWSWGDGVVTTGRTSTHAYAAAGSFTVTLTVTASTGLTDVAVRTATVAG